MNNKGQVMVIFCILLPLIILFLYTFIAKGLLIYEKTKMENILEIACKSKNIEKNIKDNDKNIKFEIKNDSDIVTIVATKDMNNIIDIIARNNQVKVIKRCDVNGK